MNSVPIFNVDAEPEPPVLQLALMVTRRCNMTCAHCSVESSPRVNGGPDEEELLLWVRQAVAANVRSILFTGGEPMIREAVVLRLMREAKQLGMSSSMTSNGFWGKTLGGARRRLKALRKAGMQRLSISYDRYHAEFQGSEPALNIAQAAEEMNFPINIGITRVADDTDLEQIVAPFRGLRSVLLRFYDIQPVGSARNFAPDSLRAETEGFCSACSSPAITDDGRMTACNGPSYFLKCPSPLFVGSLNDSSVADLVKRHRQDSVLDTIRTFGPGRLRDELKTIPGFEEFPFRAHYHGICELCQHVTGEPDAVAALRQRLDQPQHVAERMAMQRVMDDSRRSGLLNRDYVNGIGAARVFFRASAGGVNPWLAESRRLLGRADVDWNRLAQYLTSCGLARPLLPALDDAELRRWAPTFFLDAIQQRAIADGVRELIQREILRRLCTVLCELGIQGVLLKGGAVLALHHPTDTGTAQMRRSAGDIDVYIPPERAIEVRTRLLQAGFQGSKEHRSGSHHHLAAVSLQSVPVEIHTRIAPSLWELPERQMLETAIPLPKESFANLSTLDAEGMLLHATIHVTNDLFSWGLKAAWDIRWLINNFGDMDWERLARWADSSGMRRAFWVPIRVLSCELEIPVPAELLNRAPSDARQRKLELIAGKRLFSSLERTIEGNLFSTNAVIVLMQDSGVGRLCYALSFLAQIATRLISRPLRTAKRATHHIRQVRQVTSHWRQFRRATARADWEGEHNA